MANKRRKGGKIGRPPKIIVNTDGIESSLPVKFLKKCANCSQSIDNSEDVVRWETLEFCSKSCLEITMANKRKKTGKPGRPPKIIVNTDGIESSLPVQLLRKCGNCSQRIVNSEGVVKWETMEFCNKNCLDITMANKRKKTGKLGRPPKIIVNTDGMESSLPVEFLRKCGNCSQRMVNSEGVLTWETMEFCNKNCLEKFQNEIGSKCTNCNSIVKPVRLGKLCVRIGVKISQFCNTTCLNVYRTEAKICARCHKDITRDGTAIFADVGDGECKDFCTEACKIKYIRNKNQERFTNSACTTCKRQTIAIELEHGEKIVLFCGNVCYTAYKYAHNLSTNQCKSCHKYFENKILEENCMHYNGDMWSFCSPACKNKHINSEKKIFHCTICKIQKYSFDLIMVNGTDPPVMMCSLKCLGVFETSQSSKSSNTSTPTSNVTVRPAPKLKLKSLANLQLKSIENRNSTPSSTTTDSGKSNTTNSTLSSTPVNPPPAIKVPNLPAPQRNVATMCKVKTASVETKTVTITTKSVGVQEAVETNSVEVQTEGPHFTCLPIPMPIYVPLPMMMYSAPYPVPFPFPVPLPVPIFIPTSKRTYKGVTKRVKKILDRSLKDPLQDEMLMLAEMVSKGTNDAVSSSESESESESEKKIVKRARPAPKKRRPTKKVSFDRSSRAPPRRARVSNQNVSYVDYDNDTDIIPRVPKRTNKRVSFNNDIENYIDQQPRNNRRVMFADNQNDRDEYRNMKRQISDNDLSDGIDHDLNPYGNEQYPGSYRAPPKSRPLTNDFNEKEDFIKRRKRRQTSPSPGGAFKRPRNASYSSRSVSPLPPPTHPPATPQPPTPKTLPPIHELFKKPDNELHLKYSIGLSAWQQWAQAKHPGRFNEDILKLSCEELNASLCLFINEVQKPNGQIYTPDTIYYFCLGIQQHLFLSGRTDNIFYNQIYKRFTDCLDEIAKKFLVLYNDSDFIVTRIEEEHLWESKQLGAHSPQVLLNTLLFFNTKYFNLTMVEEHQSLWFSQIMKNAKYVNTKTGRTRSVVLRYYPNGKEPQGQQGKVRRKRGFEQYENEENPLRCPIRLYEFYISKCPDNMKESNECFYLLPDSTCLPESSVWYSTTTVPEHEIDKVLNRFKIVREITMALLAK